MQLRLNKLHQDLVLEDIQPLNSSSQDKKMIQQQLIMKVEEANKPWLTGQDNNYQTWKYLTMFNWQVNQFMMKIVKAAIFVSSVSYLLSLTQQSNKDKIISTPSEKLVWDSKESLSNFCGCKVVINLNFKKSLEFQVLDIHQLLLFSKQRRFMEDLKDHSVSKIWRTSWVI